MTSPRLLVAAVVLALAASTAGCSGQSAQRASDQASPGSRSTAPSAAPSTRSSPDDTLPEPLARALSGRPEPATSARGVVAQVVAAERAIADRRTPPRVLAAAGHLQQVAYRAWAEHPQWDRVARRELPAELRGVARDNVAARRALRSMHPTDPAELADELPAWRIVRPAPRQRLLRFYRQAQRELGVPWSYLAAINLVETAMGRIQGTSVAGAQGPMQFLPATWAAYGRGDVHDPHDAILGAARYLAAMGFVDDRETALRRYNDHAAYVRAVSLLAGVMDRRPRAFAGYYHWQVYYLTRRGSILLPVGYAARKPVPVAQWLARHDAG